MFTSKQSQLFVTTSKSTEKVTNVSRFVEDASAETSKVLSGNGALKYSTTQNPFVDQFSKLGSYKSLRSFSDIEKDCEILWATDQILAIKFILYLRTITRKTQLMSGVVTDTVQLGGELKHESIMRMIWLHNKSQNTFFSNLPLFVSLGSWHDVFTMLQYDLVYNGWDNRVLNWNKMGDLILSGLEMKSTSELVKKYLPHVRAKSACNTVEAQANCLIAKWLCSRIFGEKVSSYQYKLYRKMKSSGTAHEWQQLISKREFDRIDFDKIHGRALNLLVRSKFLRNQNLTEKYASWIGNSETKAKYTGFVHELFHDLPYSLSGLEKHKQDTINKQFDTLVEKGKDDRKNGICNWIVVRDTSMSMEATATGTKVSCFNIAKSLALYFSKFLTGKFADSFIEFNSVAKMHTWKGNTALEKWYNDSCSCIGNTDFQSVIDLFVQLKQDGIEEFEFPTGILCISDSEFDATTLGKTNVETSREKLRNAGFSKEFVDKFQIVLWNLQSGYYGRGTGEKFETQATTPGTYYFSGFNGAVINFLNGEDIPTPEQVFLKAMDQQVLNMVELNIR